MDEQPNDAERRDPGPPQGAMTPGPGEPQADGAGGAGGFAPADATGTQSPADATAAPRAWEAAPALGADEPLPSPPPTETTPGAPIDWQAIPSSPTTRRRRFVLVALGVATFVLVALVVSIIRGSTSNDPYEAASRDFGQKLLSMPEFKARYGTVTTDDQAFEVGQQLAASGIPRLVDADLLRYWQLSDKLLNVVDAGPCGRIFRNTIQPAEAKQMTRALDLPTFKELLDVTMLALQADLHDDPLKPSPTEAQVSSAFEKLQAALGASVTETTGKLSDASATDAEVCTAGRAFLGAVLGLSEPDRTVVLRYVISP